MRVGPAEVKVIVGGRRRTEYGHEGRTYIEAQEGEEYALRIRNTTNRKILVLPTVDGLSVLDGEEASANKADGYILDRHMTYDIPGWRVDNQQVAKFVFGSIPESYAEKSGKGGNQGVIGLACWRERRTRKRRPRRRTRRNPVNGRQETMRSGEFDSPTYDMNICRGVGSPIAERGGGEVRSCNFVSAVPPAGPAESTMDYMPDFHSESTTKGVDVEFKGDMGTEFGDRTNHRVVQAVFHEAPGTLVTGMIYYASRQALEARGIDFDKAVAEASNPFPADNQRGCQPPTGWNG
jgi:hypothetical protein